MVTPNLSVTDDELGVAALAFANTVATLDRPGDAIGTAEQLLEWLETHATHGVAPGGRPKSPPERRELLVEAHRLRGAVRSALGAISGREPIPAPARFVIERTLDAGATLRGMSKDGSVVARLHPTQPGSRWLLTSVAHALLDLVEHADPERLRRCAADDCLRWFLDTSKGGRRRWCSMATCGNRSKAARYRERHSPRS